MRFLIVEHDKSLNEMIAKILNQYDYKTDQCYNIKDAKYSIGYRNYNLILIDFALGEEIFEFIEYIRTNLMHTKVIVISDTVDVESEIKTLRSGADDFIKKPIHFDLLIARIESKLRFSNFRQIKIHDLIIAPDEEKVYYHNKAVELKGKPFEVLIHLAKHPNQIISKDQLLDSIWEEPEFVTPNVIEVAINQIRQKIDKSLGISTIETVRRRGYKFCYAQSS